MVLGLESDSELRDDSGLTISQLDAAMEEAEELELDDASTAKAAEGYPLTTNITPELLMHCEALLDLFNSDTRYSASGLHQASFCTVLSLLYWGRLL